MEHPIPVGTLVVALYEHCKTCGGAGQYTKVTTRIRESKQLGDGTFLYTMLDGRQVEQHDIVEVK